MIRIGLPSGPERIEAEGVGVFAAELEDVTDLDGSIDGERLTAVRTRVAGSHRGDLDVAIDGKSRPTTASTTWCSYSLAPVTQMELGAIRGSAKT